MEPPLQRHRPRRGHRRGFFRQRLRDGATNSSNFPTTTAAFQTASGGGYDAFVSKLNAAGSGLVYSTYLGGSSDDFGDAIAVDSVGLAYVTGATCSTNFPTTTRAFQTTNASGGCYYAFVTTIVGPARPR